LSSGNGIIGPHEGMGAGIFMALAGRVRESEGMASEPGRPAAARRAAAPDGGGEPAARRLGRRWQSGLAAGDRSPADARPRPAAARSGGRRVGPGRPPVPT
jgi:hypothetical protein